MKPDIHPEYQQVVFQDTSVKPPFAILTRSTRTSSENIQWEDGNTYPLIKMEVSSASHPFFTGKQRLVDTAGMVERYRRRYGSGNALARAEANAEVPQAEANAEVPQPKTDADPAPQAEEAPAAPADVPAEETPTSDS